MNNNPKVTVLMSVYNCEKYIREAVNGILNQTFTDFEFLILNDGSTDKTKEIILSYKDPRIIFIENEKNLGIPQSLNKGLKLAKGEYIVHQDGDDISLPKRLDKQIEFLDQHKNIGLVGTFYMAINEEGEFLQEFQPETNSKRIKEKLAQKNQFAHGSITFRKECLNKVGYYNEDLKYTHDYDLSCRIAEHYDVANLPDCLYKWRNYTESISTRFYLEECLKLEKLLQENKLKDTNEEVGIKRKIAQGYNYLASCAFFNNQHKESLQYSKKSFSYDKLNLKTWLITGITLITSLLPKRFFAFILRLFPHIQTKINH